MLVSLKKTSFLAFYIDSIGTLIEINILAYCWVSPIQKHDETCQLSIFRLITK